MQKVTIQASRSYDILIGSGLLATLGEEVRKFPKVKTICIVTFVIIIFRITIILSNSLKIAGS